MLKKYFISPWMPIIGSFCLFGLGFFLLSVSEVVAIILFLLAVSSLIVATIFQFLNKKWLSAFGQLIVTGVFFSLFLGIFLLQYAIQMAFEDTDTFAENLEIPEGIEFSYPVDLEDGESISETRPVEFADTLFKQPHFELYNSFQPGLYEYDIWLNSNKKGVVYLRAYEITTNTMLSSSSLSNRAEVEVSNTNNRIERFGTTKHFTIYEGDWGEPYGARFEVWFTDSDTGEERKLLEKNYIIEGWMR